MQVRDNPGKRRDAQARAMLANVTGSLSPQSHMLAWQDWIAHLAISPGKQIELLELAMGQTTELMDYLNECIKASATEDAQPIAPLIQDRRFAAQEWQQWPFNWWHQAFLMQQQWWQQASQDVAGVSPHHQDQVAFAMRQWLSCFSPAHQLMSNPVVLQRTVQEGGANLQRGMMNFLDDWQRSLRKEPPAGTEDYVLGETVAATPGKVVLRNDLMELIQYSPSTEQVHPEPILIVPAWIMKYYILDLSAHNSVIKYLVDQGHTVFCISWKNPGPEDRDMGMDEYLDLGFYAALEAINTIVPERQVHAAGYCLGGTLLSIAAAAMARDGDARLASVSLLAAQTDFSEPGELALFIDEAQLAMLEAQMLEQGYLRSDQMSGAFQMLRADDLIWSKMINEYLLGERQALKDLMAWNADGTRMPAKMHSQYLRRLFLNDDLSKGRYPVRGQPVSLGDIRFPIFCVGTEKDHVAPWHSVYKLHYLTQAELTFVLTGGGHNAGIVSQPGHPRGSYRVHARKDGQAYLSPQAWQEQAQFKQGSWWVEWTSWLKERSGALGKAPRMGASTKGYKPVCDAPGLYVRER